MLYAWHFVGHEYNEILAIMISNYREKYKGKQNMKHGEYNTISNVIYFFGKNIIEIIWKK